MRLVLSEHLDRFRGWSHKKFEAEIDRIRLGHDCLKTFEGAFDDQTEDHLEFNVFWDNQNTGDVRVCGDSTISPQRVAHGFLPMCVPDAADSLIMSRDSSFVGESRATSVPTLRGCRRYRLHCFG